MNKITYLIFLLLILLTKNCWAYDANISVGNLTEFITRVQTDDSGTLNVLTFNPYIASAINFNIENSSILLSPELGFTIPKSGRDQNTNRMTFYSILNLKYNFESIFLDFGAGLFFTRIWGNGGNESLNNGNSTTSFPLPDKSTISRNTIVNLGLGHHFNSDWDAEVHTYIFNLISRDDRSYSLLLNGTYHFGEL